MSSSPEKNRTILYLLGGAAGLALVGGVVYAVIEERKKKDAKSPSSTTTTGGSTYSLAMGAKQQPHSGSASTTNNTNLIGSSCASLPPADQEQCRIRHLFALAGGSCEQLSGCERELCEKLFKNGAYPRPMAPAHVDPANQIIPPSFSREYVNGYQPRWTAPVWGTSCQTDPIEFYQGILEDIPVGYVNVDVGGLPKYDPFLKPGMNSQPFTTQWPIAQNQGFVGLHEWGMQIGNYNMSAQ